MVDLWLIYDNLRSKKKRKKLFIFVLIRGICGQIIITNNHK